MKIRSFLLIMVLFSILLSSCSQNNKVPELIEFSAEFGYEEIISSTENMIIACDQSRDRIVIYDLKNYEDGDCIDDFEVWDFLPKKSSYHLPSGVKYRENTVLGNVILIVASGGYAGIVTYPEKKLLWNMILVNMQLKSY